MTFYAAKRVSKNDDFFAFSHFIPWCVFKNMTRYQIPHLRVKRRMKQSGHIRKLV
eukprot:UN21527